MDSSVRYIMNYTQLMTAKKLVALKWMSVDAKANSCESASLGWLIRSRWLAPWQSDDPETLALIEMGWEGFLQNTHDRIVRNYPNEVGRCPKCQKLTATLQAKRCFACGNDWHDVE
jgi:hypothetical protein